MEYAIVAAVISVLNTVFFQPLQLAGRASLDAAQAPPAASLPQQLVPNAQDGTQITPFLTLPFRQGDVPADQLRIGEGWFYSDQEEAVHGRHLHRALDFDQARGTPVVAAADAYAIRSYQIAPLDRVYQGKPLGFGLGEFVQIYHPESGLYSLYGHLEAASNHLAYLQPAAYDATTWEPEAMYVSSEEFMRRATKVSRGEVIGYVGDSGITWGYNERFDSQSGHVIPRNLNGEQSWDDTHLHFEVYTRSADGRYKSVRFDPYGLYGYAGDYKNAALTATLWLTDNQGRPRYP